ncbi:hypothetical protein ACIBK8_34965 [Streptomyces sp. NPDC050161]|uniref:hypothetical protein n=1 Tax=Streptomyces sp. NPDC050161 TaxID=3365604 RepID=UPI0037AC05CB
MAGWALLGAVVTLVTALFARGLVRGARQAAREAIRRGLIALGHVQSAGDTMSQALGSATFAFAPPRAAGRECLIGWLRWRTELGDDGSLRRDTGWAVTYRRARQGVGLRIAVKSEGVEFVMPPVRTGHVSDHSAV